MFGMYSRLVSFASLIRFEFIVSERLHEPKWRMGPTALCALARSNIHVIARCGERLPALAGLLLFHLLFIVMK